MTASDVLSLFHWWMMLIVIGVLFFPLTTTIFPRFFDKGYIFAKILGIAIVSYGLFLLGLTHIVPYTKITTMLLFLIIPLVLTSLLARKKDTSFLTLWKEHKAIILLEEFLFLAGIFFLSWIRSFSPDIHGLEKYMDFGFINSINRGTSFPPTDMWLPPFSINYYYFGHLVTAVLTKLSGIPSYITYNLMLATIFAFCFTASFSIALNLLVHLKEKVKPQLLKLVVPSLLVAFLVSLAGNLHTIYTLFSPYPNEGPLPPWRLTFQPFSFPNAYWYPNATRFIYNTIHEFPIYSWVVSDLHGHVLDIPFVLTTIAVLLSLFLKFQNSNNKSQIKPNFQKQKTILWNFLPWNLFGAWKLHIWDFVLISFLLAVMYMTNAWDGGIYLLLSIFVLTVLALSPLKFFSLKNIIGYFFTKQFLMTILPPVFFLGIGFFLFMLPFNIFFKPFVSGIGILCAPKFLTDIGKIGPFLFEVGHCQHSPWWQLLILYGFFFFFVISFIVFLRKTRQVSQTDTFVLILISLSSLLIIIPEFIYMKDIYPAHYRANTMFKLVFQSFMMLSIVSGYVLTRIVRYVKESSKLHARKTLLLVKVWLFIAGVFLVFVFIYPFLAINSYYSGLQKSIGLDGLQYLKNQYSTDYEGILWLNKYIQGNPVILEAQGDSYTDYARVSANTGLPTVLGWPVHEWLWRGQYDYDPQDPKRLTDEVSYYPAPRIGDIQKLYESSDLQETRSLINKYTIEYIFIGDLERQKYPAINDAKWDKLGKNVFEKGSTKIYKLAR